MTAGDRGTGDAGRSGSVEVSAGLELVEAEARGPERVSVIWLHGMGQDTGHPAAIADRLGLAEQGVRAVFPRAPAQAKSSITGAPTRAWVDQSVLKLGTTDPVTLAATEEGLRHLIEEESKRVGAEHVVLAGFSQGAAMALYVALRYPERLGGLALYAAFRFGDVPLMESRSAANAELPVWLGHGRRDWVIPYFIGIDVRDLLEEHGHPVEWHKYPGAHEAFGGVGSELAEFLDRVAAK
ncbi:alpha/beta hydrolase [Catenulispora subtropica]|uniref:Phospholipase/carboxylesterase n=1 Tax=Catenulispora subtropica TaxID=450798 RepID=A0ABN2RDR6_9ACTN